MLQSSHSKVKSVSLHNIRTMFIHEQLVFVPKLWSSPEICLWSSSVKIKGRPILGGHYPLLEEFFINRLGVQKAQLSQIIAELVRKAKTATELSASDSRDFLFHISSMLTTDEPEDDSLAKCLDDLVQTRFLPVRCGANEPRLVNCSSPFVIGDSYEYNKAFEGKCAFLDISFEEVPQVSRMLRALPVDLDWLSEIVERTSVVSGDSILDEALTQQFQRKAACLFS